MSTANWNDIAGLIVASFSILGVLVGVLAWLFRLEFQVRQNKEVNADFKKEIGVLETRVETKVDNLQASMTAILVTMGELKGRMSSQGYDGQNNA